MTSLPSKLILPALLCAATTMLQAQSQAQSIDEQQAKRVYDHIRVGDMASACTEASTYFMRDTASPILFEAAIAAHAKSGNEKAMGELWANYSKNFPDLQTKRELLETMAWGVIQNGARSSAPLIRVMALLGAFFGQDAKSVDILCDAMKDQNSRLRMVAVELSGQMRDARIQDAVMHLSQNDRCWDVRIQAVKAIGNMQLEEAQPLLMALIADDTSIAEEKAAAIEALTNILDSAERKEIARLVQSQRAGLRLLACQIVAHLEMREECDLLTPLLHDHNPRVREAAVRTLGYLRIENLNGMTISEAIHPLLADHDTYVAISAAWLILLNDPPSGQRALKPWLVNKERPVRLYAAATLASSGKYGLPLLQETFASTDDEFVKMNTALGLIGQRQCVGDACNYLYESLNNPTQRWMWDEEHGFRVLAPSTVKHDDLKQNYPEAVNQLVRLEIVNILSILKHPKAQAAMRQFLLEKNWGITGMAAALLLTEGDEDAVGLVEELLHDPDPKIRFQAGLIVAMWGRSDASVALLQDSYASSTRETKEKILEGLGRVCSPSSIPFLADKLREPSQSLRIIAAAALLECLNN